MKHIFILTLALAGISSTASAITINCLPAEQQNVTSAVSTGAQTFTCGTGLNNLLPIGSNGDGIFIVSARLGLTGTISDNNAAKGASYSVTFTGQNVNGPFTIANWSLIVTGSPVGPNQFDLFTVGANGTLASGTDNSINLDSIPSFNVTVTGVVTPGNTIPQSASSSLVFEYTERATVPEPATYAMIGSAIAALALIKRRNTNRL